MIRIDMAGKSLEYVAKLDDPELLEAVIPPRVPRLASRIFEFLRENENLTTVAGGMQHYVTGLDRAKLFPTARNEYGLDLSRYRFAVNMYEQGLLRRQKETMSD